MMSESEVLSFMEEYKKEHSVLIDSYKAHVRKLRADAATHSSAFYTFDENLYVNIFGFAAKIAIYEVDKEDYEEEVRQKDEKIRIKVIRIMYRSMGLSPERIAEVYELPFEYVESTIDFYEKSNT